MRGCVIIYLRPVNWQITKLDPAPDSCPLFVLTLSVILLLKSTQDKSRLEKSKRFKFFIQQPPNTNQNSNLTAGDIGLSFFIESTVLPSPKLSNKYLRTEKFG